MHLNFTGIELPSGEIVTIRSTPDGRAACPVCGLVAPGEWPYVPSSLHADGIGISLAHASHNICPCCSTQYGDNDFVEPGEGVTQEKKWQQLRYEWLRRIQITDQARAQLRNLGLEPDEEIQCARRK